MRRKKGADQLCDLHLCFCMIDEAQMLGLESTSLERAFTLVKVITHI